MQRKYMVKEANSKGEPIPVYVDDRSGNRVPLSHGTTFTAELDTKKMWDRRGREPVQVDTGVLVVTKADVNVHPGCLTSLIRTGRAVPVEGEKQKATTK